ncbi:MAG: hypothetical protein NZ602_09780 [Thermoguttaceae bacterium]|nr:hypothetical protein [Thermoguttaceae bacterium]MDW8039132.1 FHA domain-containing protein [Thermoguttaceae bacterium]
MGELAPCQASRFLLWVDGGGGYLICLKEMVVLGHADGGPEVDIPLLAPISPQHLRLWREPEGYLIEPLESVLVEGRVVEGLSWLRDGNHIQLGGTVRMRFRLPHPYSLTARLELLSAHRTEPRTNSVLLMGQSCLVGPESNCHIFCPWMRRPVVLFRYQGGLYCRTEGWLELDGHRQETMAGPLSANSRLRAEGLSLGLEAF